MESNIDFKYASITGFLSSTYLSKFNIPSICMALEALNFSKICLEIQVFSLIIVSSTLYKGVSKVYYAFKSKYKVYITPWTR